MHNAENMQRSAVIFTVQFYDYVGHVCYNFRVFGSMSGPYVVRNVGKQVTIFFNFRVAFVLCRSAMTCVIRLL